MSEILRHPGLLSDCLSEEQARDARRNRKLENYLIFANLEGVSPVEQEIFKEVTNLIFESTKGLWEPSKCDDYTILVRRKLKSEKIPTVISGAELVILSSNEVKHFWTEINFPSGTRVIVDPTGISIDDNEETKPYFGLIEKAPHYSRPIYEGASTIRA